MVEPLNENQELLEDAYDKNGLISEIRGGGDAYRDLAKLVYHEARVKAPTNVSAKAIMTKLAVFAAGASLMTMAPNIIGNYGGAP